MSTRPVSAAIRHGFGDAWPTSLAANDRIHTPEATAGAAKSVFDAPDWLWAHLRDARSR